MATKHGGHSFLGAMSVFIFLALLANLAKPWLPVEWRQRLFPPQEVVEQTLPSEVVKQAPPSQEALSLSEYVTKADLQRILSRADTTKMVTSSGASPCITAEDLDLFEQRLAERFVTVERLEEMLAHIAQIQRKMGGKLSSPSQVTIIVPVPPTRPLPHPLPGRQF